MHEPSTPRRAESLAEVESAIHMMLTVRDEQRPWSVQEVEQAIGDAADVADALANLAGAGLIHRCDRFVWATRAALAADGLAG
jgi:hypothetical protein